MRSNNCLQPALTDRPDPAGLYIHWPYCEAICPYCDFNVYKAREDAPLAAGLVQALQRVAQRWPDLELTSIYFGGGTPGLMDPAHVARLGETARTAWPASPNDLEITLEVNPTAAETQRLQAFADAGVNRLSLGVQSLDEKALKFLARRHSAADARQAYDRARGLFRAVSVDLIC